MRKIAIFGIFVLCLLFSVCSQSTTPEKKTTATKPTINSFYAYPSTIKKGESTTLSWSTSNATSASIDQGIGSVPTSGNQTVYPTVTTIYTLTAVNSSGTVSATTIVTVTAPDCQIYHTGTLKVENRSKRSLDYNVIIDNINYGRLKVGEIRYFQVSVGTHSLAFAWADHAGYACGTGYPSIIECQTSWFYCDQ